MTTNNLTDDQKSALHQLRVQGPIRIYDMASQKSKDLFDSLVKTGQVEIAKTGDGWKTYRVKQ